MRCVGIAAANLLLLLLLQQVKLSRQVRAVTAVTDLMQSHAVAPGEASEFIHQGLS